LNINDSFQHGTSSAVDDGSRLPTNKHAIFMTTYVTSSEVIKKIYFFSAHIHISIRDLVDLEKAE